MDGYLGWLSLDCWGGNYAIARYRFRLPDDARYIERRMRGSRGCCEPGPGRDLWLAPRWPDNEWERQDAFELGFIGLAEALKLTLLLADKEPEKYDRAVRWHVRLVQDSKNVELRESLAVLALLAAIPANRLAAVALAELLSRRHGLERPCETLVAWGRRGIEST